MKSVLRPSLSRPRWRHVEPNFYGQVALGNMTQYWMFISHIAKGVAVGIERKGFFVFDPHQVSADYVMEKLGLKFDGDAANIADLINAQLGIDTEYGEYDERFCYRAGGSE